MPKTSKRSQLIPASPIRRLVPFADTAKQKGIHVHHLNIGQPDIETPKAMMDAYRNFDDAVPHMDPRLVYLSYEKRFPNILSGR